MIETASLYLPLHLELMALLRELKPTDWTRETICRGWTLQDVAAHMLDTQIRILSQGRDGYTGVAPDGPIDSFGSLVDFLNRLNNDWVKVARRISPRILMEMLDQIGPQLATHVESLDPNAQALFPVAWAGEDASPNWFDIGRNYTEYWHHQQQIRDAVGAPGLFARRWLYPVIALFLRAVPRAYTGSEFTAGTTVRIQVTGEAGGIWSLTRDQKGWSIEEVETQSPQASVTLSDDTAWRFLTKGLDPAVARTRVSFAGDLELAAKFLDSRAVMA
jgi:uncharacterized protein (TIGR03083 family)